MVPMPGSVSALRIAQTDRVASVETPGPGCQDAARPLAAAGHADVAIRAPTPPRRLRTLTGLALRNPTDLRQSFEPGAQRTATSSVLRESAGRESESVPWGSRPWAGSLPATESRWRRGKPIQRLSPARNSTSHRSDADGSLPARPVQYEV